MEHNFLVIKPPSRSLRALDRLLRPLMRLAAGPRAWREEPQSSHRWNVVRFSCLPADVARSGIAVPGDPAATRRWLMGFLPIFHIPLFGGWKRYVVLEPVDSRVTWLVGWSAQDSIGCSRISGAGPVRMLLSRHPTSFFGVAVGTGKIVPLRIVGYGTIGDGGPYSQLPLR
jgi:hypothetical protein